MRNPSNLERDRKLLAIGFDLTADTAVSATECPLCGYDRYWTAEQYRDWCAFCASSLPVPHDLRR
jgi:hypothetical protein